MDEFLANQSERFILPPTIAAVLRLPGGGGFVTGMPAGHHPGAWR